ncbi:hypothetical protein RvY_06679 [Ramazzottius varieornatus]|uniref:Uncharacterized protein n=1 Tax=Ramazzottius varieornatus TaxID=947166 RepID=A0A1D1V5M9_RAMVA|nr:hypothetical protein RvY_06679 [Ramazzottius varieornatus]
MRATYEIESADTSGCVHSAQPIRDFKSKYFPLRSTRNMKNFSSPDRTFVHETLRHFPLRCQKCDFGSEKENMKHYGSNQPPEYPIADLKVPIALIYSDNDWLATPKDVLCIGLHITLLKLMAKKLIKLFRFWATRGIER